MHRMRASTVRAPIVVCSCVLRPSRIATHAQRAVCSIHAAGARSSRTPASRPSLQHQHGKCGQAVLPKLRKQQAGSELLDELTMAVPAAIPGLAAAGGGDSNTWDAKFRLHNTITSAPLTIRILDGETGELSAEISVSKWQTKTWTRAISGDLDGTFLIGKMDLGKVTNPGAALISYVGPEVDHIIKARPDKQLQRVYITDVTLTPEGWMGEEVPISVHSWVNLYHTQTYGPRVFFAGGALLPKDTPPTLVEARALDLAIIQGVDDQGIKIAKNPRLPADRIEDYATYNDLGTHKAPRPVLGRASGDETGFAYPRRLATNRKVEHGKEAAPGPLGRWVPADDDFDEAKDESFNGSVKYAAIPLVLEQLIRAAERLVPAGLEGGLKGAVKTGVTDIFSFFKHGIPEGVANGSIGGFFESFNQAMVIYSNLGGGTAEIVTQAKLGHLDDKGQPAVLSMEEQNHQVRQMIMKMGEQERALLLKKIEVTEEELTTPKKVVPPEKWQELRHTANLQLDWPEPYVLKGYHTPQNESDGPLGIKRHDAWQSDEEFGRQYKAGTNPLTMVALKQLPAGSALADKLPLINSLLEAGDTVDGLMEEVKNAQTPRIFIIDYEPHVPKAALYVNGKQPNRCQYAGRALLYQRKDTKLVPVALELHAPQGDPDTGKVSQDVTTVYTRKDPAGIWLLAKAAFNSIDSGVHQLISHWLRTHCAVEPYIIATHRCLSQMHPLAKLLQPHLQFTYSINAQARTVLVSADTIIELTFTPGSYCMQLSADVYQDWKFTDQAFPADVISRGLAKKAPDGSVEIIAQDHPWAEDGKLIWDALHTYIADYLKLYYKNDSDIAGDQELNSWWTEIRTKGHPDALVSGWPELNTVDDLALIAATIAWTASAHHAAVNFGQNDYNSFLLNRSSLLHKKIPAPGTPEYKALTEATQERFEGEFMKYVSNQLPASIVITVLEILSTHSQNEHYLSDTQAELLYDPAALEVHAALVKNMAAAERLITERNTSGSSVARTPAAGGLPYQLLLPGGVGQDGTPLDPEGDPDSIRVANRPGRGIPFSISI